MPHIPPFTAQRLIDVFPAALSFTLLGDVESLLRRAGAVYLPFT